MCELVPGPRDKPCRARLDFLRHRSPGTDGHRQSGRHGFQRRHADRFLYTRPNEEIGRSVYRIQVGRLQHAEEADLGCAVRKQASDVGVRLAVADDQEMRAGARQARPGLRQTLVRSQFVARPHHADRNGPDRLRRKFPFGRQPAPLFAPPVRLMRLLYTNDRRQAGTGGLGLQERENARLVIRIEKEHMVGQPDRIAHALMAAGPGPGCPLRRKAGLGDDIGQADCPAGRRADQIRRLVEQVIGEPEVGRIAPPFVDQPLDFAVGLPLEIPEAIPVHRLRHVAAHAGGDRRIVTGRGHGPQQHAGDRAVAGGAGRVGRLHRRIEGDIHRPSFAGCAPRPMNRSCSARTVSSASNPDRTRSSPPAP